MKKKILLASVLLVALLFTLCSCFEKNKETTVVFDLGNGETKAFTVKDFSDIEIPADPKREGYVFDGWYFDNGYTEAFTLTALSSKEKGEKITVYSKWTAYSELEFKYEFYLDGAKIGEDTVKGMKLPETENASKTGYVFLGWYLDEAFEIPFAEDKIKPEMADSATKLYAKMKPLSECEFNLQFTVDGAVYSKVLTTGTAFTYPAPPEKSGYAFGGWYLDEECRTEFNQNALASFSEAEPIILYAKFIKLTAVNFYIGETLYATKYTHDGQITLPESPEKENYTFGGWYLDVDYKTVFNLDALASLLPSESVSVYAKFTKVASGTGYSVKFYIDGELYATKQTTSGKITLPAPPEKEHMTFVGWYYDIAFKYEFDESDYISENKSLYALFENKEIIATLKNGDSISSTKITYGESYTLTKYSLDTENKKRFLGWAVEGSDTLITDNLGNSLSPSAFDKDVTLIAVWDSYSYSLRIYVPGEEHAKEYFLKSDRLDFIVSDPMSDKWYYTFAGWYTDTDEKIDVNNHVFTENLKLTAKFVLSDEAMPLVLDRKTQFKITFANGFPKNGETYKAIWDFNENVLGKYFFGSSKPVPYTERYDDSPLTSGYEILIGPDALFRGDECCIDSTALGETGYVIKIVGNIIVIAGGSDAATKEAFLKFTEDFVTLAVDSEYFSSYKHIVVKKDTYYEKKHDFPVESIKIGGANLSEFTICTNYNSSECGDIAEHLRDMICEVSGYYLNIRQSREYCVCEHHIFITDAEYNYNYEKDENGDGFVIYVEDGKMVIACLYPLLFEETVMDFAAEYITGKTGSISFDNGFVYTKSVSSVSYEDFGAVGDGVTDDFEAIYNTHIHANATGQKVLGKAGATYYIGDRFTKTIPVKTSVDFRGATIIINDKGNVALEYRGLELFTVSDEPYKIMASELEGMLEMYEGDTVIPWLSHLFSKETAMVRVVNSSDKLLYEKYTGANTAPFGGIIQSETFIVDYRGNIQNGDYVRYKYENISYVEIFLDYDAGEQVIENGVFKTIRALTSGVTSGYLGNESYNRGISVYYKSNVTLRNITHEVIGEPSYNQGNSLAFNYDNFISFSHCYGVNVIDAKLYAQKQYSIYNNLIGTRSVIPNDLRISSCTDVTIDGLTLFNDKVITDNAYNDVLRVVNTKNLVMKNSRINSVELIGILGGKIEKSTIGRVIELIGGGDLIFDEVVRIANKNFVELDSKYGAYFNGNITFKNCEMKGEKAYNSNNGETSSTGSFANLFLITSEFTAGDIDYVNCEYFDGDPTMPYTVTVEGEFKVKSGAKAHVFQDISDEAFDPDYSYGGLKAYVVTRKIIFKNATAIDITNGESEVLNSIDVETK